MLGGGGIREQSSAIAGGGGTAEEPSAVTGGGGIAEQVGSAVAGGGGMLEQVGSAVTGGGGMLEQVGSAIAGGGGMLEHDRAVGGGGGITDRASAVFGGGGIIEAERSGLSAPGHVYFRPSVNASPSSSPESSASHASDSIHLMVRPTARFRNPRCQMSPGSSEVHRTMRVRSPRNRSRANSSGSPERA